MYRYTRGDLEKTAAQSLSVAETCRHLGITKAGGSTQTNIRDRLRREKIDTSHFLGQRRNLGTKSSKRLTYQEVLVQSTKLHREHAHVLRRALIESGRLYQCVGCRNRGQWEGQQLTLEVHHIDGNWRNNQESNLIFVCPNCHQLIDH